MNPPVEATPVSLERHGAIALVRIANPPINALPHAVRQGLVDAVQSAKADTDLAAVVICCQGGSFAADTDMDALDKPALADVLMVIDRCDKPIVAALSGSIQGGAFELAMACHYRVLLRGTRLGLPEVRLGLIPGAGGTQMLPRLVGVAKALEIATSGRSVAAESLTDTPVVDQLAEAELLTAALAFARALVANRQGRRSTLALKPHKPQQLDTLLARWRQQLAKKARGQMAPQYIVDLIASAVALPFAEGQKRERALFVKCRNAPQSRAMRHAFAAERAAEASGTTEVQAIEQLGVIGAGTMGSAIAMCFASKGIPVRLVELNPQNLQRGLEKIQRNYQQTLERGLISAAQMQAAINAITGTTDYTALSRVDFVVEAAFENIDIKRDIFSALDRVCKPHTILASNTSYLDINKIAAATSRPHRVLGMHFFSPAHVMKLLELVRARHTDDHTLATAMALGRHIGKICVTVGHCYGFVGNRSYACYNREAQRLLLEGASPEQIDSAMQAWGMAMGPLAVSDLSGIDIAYSARHANKTRFARDPLYCRAADLMVEAGRLGRKTGAGFYRYVNNRKQPDPEVGAIISAEAHKLGVPQRTDISAEEIQNRLLFALINEGANILEQGLARSAGDIDVIWLNGYGFPRFRGGPMYYADEIGLGRVLDIIQRFEQQLGPTHWAASSLLKRLHQSGKTLGGAAAVKL